MAQQKMILLHEKDNTITALADLKQGEEIHMVSSDPPEGIAVRKDIPYAHKLARTLIPKGADVIKYGEVIGVATADIQPGDHVHIHNVESKRTR